jgi:hypothetical protein
MRWLPPPAELVLHAAWLRVAALTHSQAPTDDAYGPAVGVVVVVSEGDGVGVPDGDGVVSVVDGAGDGVPLGVGVGAGPPAPPPPPGALVRGTPGAPALDCAGWLAVKVDANAVVGGAGHDA